MTGEQVLAAQRRAEEVVNGFRRVREQQARDAYDLAVLCGRQAALIVELRRQLGHKPSGDDGFAAAFDEIWRSIGIVR